MPIDDNDLNHIQRIYEAQAAGKPAPLPARPGVPLIMASSGLVCPECGFEPKRLDDGQPSDAIQFNIQGVKSPYYHVACAQGALMARDAQHIKENVRPFEEKAPQQKEETDADSSAA